jgi:oxygen-independent coproporphyrinogen-3 oxidase
LDRSNEAAQRERFKDQIRVTGHRISLDEDARLIARLAAQEVDAYSMPEGRHSRAL